jgi:hypothetical protein
MCLTDFIMEDLNTLPVGIQEISVRMPERQAIVLMKYCTLHELTLEMVILAALAAMIEDFDQA